MRTHFLNQLSIAGRDKALALEPSFDFYKVGKVCSLRLEFESEDILSVHLVAEYSTPEGRRYRLAMLLEGVRRLLLPQMSPLLTLPELEVEDVSDRSLEGIRFEVVSQFERAFQCTCRDISIVEFSPL